MSISMDFLFYLSIRDRDHYGDDGNGYPSCNYDHGRTCLLESYEDAYRNRVSDNEPLD